MWKIHAGGLQIYSDTEAACRNVYQGYKEWRVWQGSASASQLNATVGSHPVTWTLPVELVDPAGNPKERMGSDPT
jgi:hypothetical protein